MRPRARLRLAILLVILHLCNFVPAQAKVPVMASILPLGDFCEKIGGQWVEVKVLIPPGASPHVFEPSPTAVAEAAKAKVFVYVGAGLDPWAERLLRAKAQGQIIAVAAVEGLPLIEEASHHRHPPHEEEREHHQEMTSGGKPSRPQQGGNPHVWLDPVLAQDICRRLAKALSTADPAHEADFKENLARYLKELDGLHEEIQAAVKNFRLREYVTFHPAFTYFSRRYGLREVGVIEEAPGREPSPGHIRRIIETIREKGVKAVFAEPQFNPRVAEIIAREAGVRVLILDPLGGRPPYGTDYIKMMRHNLEVLGQALQ